MNERMKEQINVQTSERKNQQTNERMKPIINNQSEDIRLKWFLFIGYKNLISSCKVLIDESFDLQVFTVIGSTKSQYQSTKSLVLFDKFLPLKYNFKFKYKYNHNIWVVR